MIRSLTSYIISSLSNSMQLNAPLDHVKKKKKHINVVKVRHLHDAINNVFRQMRPSAVFLKILPGN